MNKKNPRRGRNNSFEGTFIGNATGANSSVGNVSNITVTSTEVTSSVSLEDLRDAITALLAQLEAAGDGAAADDRIRYELETIKEEIEEDEPDGAAVRSRWKQVQKLLSPLQQVAGVAQSAERVFTLIRTLFTGS